MKIQRQTPLSKRQVIVAAAVASLLVGGIAGTSVAASHRSVTVNVDGVSVPVSGFATTVGAILADGNITVGDHDVVAPEVDAEVNNGDTVVVRRANAYQVMIDGQAQTVWSTGKSVKEVLSDAGHAVVMAADRSEARADLTALAGQDQVTVKADGKSHQVQAEANDTATDLLAKAGVTVSALDRVFYGMDNGAVVVDVTRVTRGVTDEKQDLPFETEERDDDSLTKGTKKVIQEGKDGTHTVSYWVEKVGNQVTVKAKTGETTTDPVKEIVAVGTKPAQSVGAGGAGVAAGQGSGTGSAPDGVWAALAQCESGGNPGTNTGNGFYGLYQFSLPTWQSLGGVGLPSDASAAEQTRLAQALQARSGWGQWPACSASLGLY